MNYGKIAIGDNKKNTDLTSFVNYRKGDITLIVPKNNKEIR